MGLSINSLPTEILAHIFYRVLGVQSCPLNGEEAHSPTKALKFMKCPVTLSHVCSGWRRLAIDLPSLWSHIDLVPGQFRGTDERLQNQLDTYMTRSCQTLLDLHIIETVSNGGLFASREADPAIVEFLCTISLRLQSINLSVAFGPHPGYFFRSVLAACFAGCKSKTLTKIAIEVVSRHGRFDISRGIHFHTLTGQSEETTEAIFLHITEVRLGYFFPSWNSQLYHGLTVLHLVSSRLIAIPESQLVAILRSSPSLRVLKFGLEIENPYAGRDPVVPVSLENLEVVVVSSEHEWHLGALLRWIAPGTKPLSLSVVDPFIGGQKFRSRSELSSFFARSNVTRIHAKSFDSYSHLVEVLRLAPTIRVLAVDFLSDCGLDEVSLSYDVTIHELYVIRSPYYGAIYWHSIEGFIKKHNVQALTLWRHTFRYSSVGNDLEGSIPDNFYTICPCIRVIPNENPNPIEEWC